MKKIILSAVIAIAAAFSANAQFWAGGSFDLESHNKSVGFGFSPEVGYTFNGGPWAVGARLDLNFEEGYTGVGLSPYARYTFWKTGVASLFVDGVLGFRLNSFRSSYNRYMSDDYYDELEDIIDEYYDDYDSDNTFTFSIGVSPGLAIALSEKLSLVTRLGNLGLDLKKYSGSDDVSVNFGFGLDGGIANVGLFYTF